MTVSRSPAQWLIAATIATVAINLMLLATLTARGTSARDAPDLISWGLTARLAEGAPGVDSLRPMLAAWRRAEARADRDIYGLFFAEHTKFQYPPTALLLFAPLPRVLLEAEVTDPDTRLRRLWSALSQALVLGTIVLTVVILEYTVRRELPGERASRTNRLTRIALATFLAATFYPLTRAHNLGQIQVLLNALAAGAVLLHLAGYRAWSGVCFGLCCLVKPQFGVIVLWGLLRREWRFVAGLVAVTLPLALLSVAQFGWVNHARYLEVISAIARTGEAFWPNQSVNGLLNRFTGNGDPLQFSREEFPPYDPAIHAATWVSGFLILLAALWAGKRWCPQPGSSLDLAVVLAAATLASPVAWEHHYGVFLPLFALALPVCVRKPALGRWTAPVLALSFLAMANVLRAPAWIFATPWRGLLGSHLFFGAIVLFALLLALRAQESAHASHQ